MCMLDEIRAKRDEIYAIARAHTQQYQKTMTAFTDSFRINGYKSFFYTLYNSNHFNLL